MSDASLKWCVTFFVSNELKLLLAREFSNCVVEISRKSDKKHSVWLEKMVNCRKEIFTGGVYEKEEIHWAFGGDLSSASWVIHAI